MVHRTLGWGLISLLGCGPVIVAPGAGSESGEETTVATVLDTSAADEATGIPPSMTASTTGDATTSPSTDSSGDDTGADFITRPDGGHPHIDCDLWTQDCPRGEKCMPWANDGGAAWNATRCSPIAEDPRAVGEPCTVVDSGTSGIDDCVLGAMCWNVDPETNTGECVGFCEGSEANPTCADSCDTCPIGGEGVLILCLPQCDPIEQDCGEGQACYPYSDTFACSPDASANQGGIGEPCAFINACAAGNFCANADAVPGCEGNGGCCAPYCDVEGADGCDALLPGTSCVPWFEQGQGQGDCNGTGAIGACLLP